MNEMAKLLTTLIKTRDGYRVVLVGIALAVLYQTIQIDKRLAVVEWVVLGRASTNANSRIPFHAAIK
jgi:hypothetical protein